MGLAAAFTSIPAGRLLRCLTDALHQIVWQFGGARLGLIHHVLSLT
jgi:hypothetical protein